MQEFRTLPVQVQLAVQVRHRQAVTCGQIKFRRGVFELARFPGRRRGGPPLQKGRHEKFIDKAVAQSRIATEAPTRLVHFAIKPVEADTQFEPIRNAAAKGQRENPVGNRKRVIVRAFGKRFSFLDIGNIVCTETGERDAESLPLAQRNDRRRKVVLGVLVVFRMRKGGPSIVHVCKLVGVRHQPQVVSVNRHSRRAERRRASPRFDIESRICTHDTIGRPCTRHGNQSNTNIFFCKRHI